LSDFVSEKKFSKITFLLREPLLVYGIP